MSEERLIATESLVNAPAVRLIAAELLVNVALPRLKVKGGVTLMVSSYISRGGRKGRRVITLLLTLALEGSQLHTMEGAEMTNGKRRTLMV